MERLYVLRSLENLSQGLNPSMNSSKSALMRFLLAQQQLSQTSQISTSNPSPSSVIFSALISSNPIH